jgi:uncharacterized protein YkwD
MQRMKIPRKRSKTHVLIRHAQVTALVALTALWSGCDHGSPLPPVSPTPGPLASGSPVPSPTPSSVPSSTPNARLRGRVVDHESGKPLSRAVVVLSHEQFPTDTPPASVVGFVGVTDAQGSFHLDNVPAGTYPIEIYTAGHITLHQQITVAGNNELPAFRVSHLTIEELHWLSQLNHDRAAWGAPPLVADEAAVEAARMRAATLADNGVFSHTCGARQTHCLTGVQAELAYGAYRVGGENLGAQNQGDWRDIESGMLAEWTRCNPAVHKPHVEGCGFSENTGHFLNIVNRTYRFVGVAAAHRGRSFDVSFGPKTDYYAMEFE